MKIQSILKKIKKLLIFRTIRGTWKYDNFFLHSVNEKPIKSILFYFNDPEFMHLGDHLFFEPLASELNKQGFKVIVLATKTMEPYFSLLGYQTKIPENITLSSFDLIITKFEFSDLLKKIDCNCLYINTSYTKSNEFLCNDIINKTSKILNFTSSQHSQIPAKPILKNLKIKLPNEYQYIVFNNYVDSSSYRLTCNDYKALYEFVTNLAKKEKLKIIHVGTDSEKQRDDKTYNDVYIDIRGKTSMLDIFQLAEHPNVKYCVSFDVFIAHVFFISNKKTFVKFRGRFSKKRTKYIIDYVLPPFETLKQKSNLVEFI